MRLPALLLLLTACAAPQRPDYPLIDEGEEADAVSASSEPAPAAAPAPQPAGCAVAPDGERRMVGTITRDELDDVLDKGPPAFLRGVRVDAALVGRHFHGWRVQSFWPCEPRYASVDLLPGDVVLRVNATRIERPEQLTLVWEGLREASVLTVDLERGGQPRRLEYTIVD